MNKLNLKYGEMVKIKNLSDELDGKYVKIIGLSNRNVLDTYIVSWEHVETMPDFGEYSAFCVTESCLERI
jgi:hypothetical protein